MLSESAIVVGLQAGNILLKTDRHSTCTSCSLKGGCGQYLLSRDRDVLQVSHSALVDLAVGETLQTGDRVQVLLAPGPFLQLVALHYLLPLVGLLLATMLASFWNLSEPVVVLAGFTGLAGGFLTSRFALRDMKVMPGLAACSRAESENNLLPRPGE